MAPVSTQSDPYRHHRKSDTVRAAKVTLDEIELTVVVHAIGDRGPICDEVAQGMFESQGVVQGESGLGKKLRLVVAGPSDQEIPGQLLDGYHRIGRQSRDHE